jgi:hypothetical protein
MWSSGDQPIHEQKFAMSWLSKWMDIQWDSRPFSEKWVEKTSLLLKDKIDISLESAVLLVEAWLIFKREAELSNQ